MAITPKTQKAAKESRAPKEARRLLTKKPSPEALNLSMMSLIRKVHGMIDHPDIEKHRHSQDQVGALLGNAKDVLIRPLELEGMEAEWVCVNRVHMKKYVILYCHGGGYSTGSSVYARTLTTKLAASTSMDVLCFDYRLAPENPYPAALEDAVKVWDYLMLFGYGARDIILAGDSAGGNLALALTLKLKEEKRLLPRGLVLLSPWTDLTSSGKSHESRKEADPVLDEEYLNRMIHNYAPKEELAEPLISPLFGDFSGFPPTYIQVGDNEILLNDSVSLHKKMIKENVSVKMDVYKGMWHVFQMSPLQTSYEAMEKCAEFIYDICR